MIPNTLAKGEDAFAPSIASRLPKANPAQVVIIPERTAPSTTCPSVSCISDENHSFSQSASIIETAAATRLSAAPKQNIKASK